MRNISDFENLITARFRPKFIREIQLHPASDCLTSNIAAHPQLLCIMNHGGFLGPWAAALAFQYLYFTHGGQRRRPTGVAWRGFYTLPIYKQIAHFLTQLDHPLNFQTCLELINSNQIDDMIILPEGSNCHYFDGQQLQPFISPRFIELSIKTATPMLLFIHQGSEHWGTPIPLPERWTPMLSLLPKRHKEGLQRSRKINIPHMLKGKIPRLTVLCKLYQPRISREVWNTSQNQTELLLNEAEYIRHLMQDHYQTLINEHIARNTRDISGNYTSMC